MAFFCYFRLIYHEHIACPVWPYFLNTTEVLMIPTMIND